jgi:hypothetical protein
MVRKTADSSSCKPLCQTRDFLRQDSIWCNSTFSVNSTVTCEIRERRLCMWRRSLLYAWGRDTSAHFWFCSRKRQNKEQVCLSIRWNKCAPIKRYALIRFSVCLLLSAHILREMRSISVVGEAHVTLFFCAASFTSRSFRLRTHRLNKRSA